MNTSIIYFVVSLRPENSLKIRWQQDTLLLENNRLLKKYCLGGMKLTRSVKIFMMLDILTCITL